jgi:hypothetical protein
MLTSSTYLIHPRLRNLPFHITERDLEVLSALHRYRLLDRTQIERLFFTAPHGQPSNRAHAIRRLKHFYDHGLVERVQRAGWWGKPNPGPAYRLAGRGAQLLADQIGIENDAFAYWGKSDDRDYHPTRVSNAYVDHTLQMAEVRMIFERAADQAGCSLVSWLDHYDLMPTWKTERVWIELKDRKGRVEVAVTPDAYFALDTARGRGHFFVELDRGTETIYRAWQQKVLAYKEYWRSGKFAQRYAKGEGRPSFRVLVITPTASRATNIKRAAEQFGASEAAGLFLMAALPTLDHQCLTAPIWVRGGLTAPQTLI